MNTKPWPETPDGLRQMYDQFVATHGRAALRLIAEDHGIAYGTAQKRLVAAGVHVGVKRPSRSTGACPCGAEAKAGRYKGKGDPLCTRCYQRTYAADTESGFKRKARDYIAEVKENAVCADCGGKFPSCVYHFDHVPERGPKLFNLGSGDYAIETVRAEIAKCDIVCANCHAIRTWITRKRKA